MWKLAVILLLAGSALGEKAARSSSGPCSEDALMSCAYPTTVEKSIRFAMNEEELEANCPHLHNSLRCIDTYTRDCLEPKQRSIFYRSYSGAGMVLQEICSPGPYREQFLRMAPCVNNVTEEYMACAHRYEEALDKYPPGIKTCGELERYVTCSETVVRGICGEEAAVFTGGFLHRMTEAIFMDHCRQKSHASISGSTGVFLTVAAFVCTYILS